MKFRLDDKIAVILEFLQNIEKYANLLFLFVSNCIPR